MTNPIAPGFRPSPSTLNQRPEIRQGVDSGRKIKEKAVDPEMLKAAQGIEAMFLEHMISAMRKTVPENELDLESNATKIYRNLLDTEVSEQAARTGGVGLADQIIAYFEASDYNLKRNQGSQPERQSGTGGTHESQ